MTPSWITRGLFPLVLIGSLLFRIWFSLHDDGIHWPDEIFQGLEQAHRLVYGYGLIGWEFVVGARNWTFPGLIAALLKMAQWIGWQEPQQYLIFLKIFFCFVSMATVLGVYYLARLLGASSLAAVSGASFFSLAAPVVYFSPRIMVETASALSLVWAFFFLLNSEESHWKKILGLSLVGLSVLIRIQNAIFCIIFLVTWALERQWKLFFKALFVFGFWAFLYGFIDKLTWGAWFHSALVYLTANVLENRANQCGIFPFWHYFQTSWSAMPTSSMILILLTPFSLKKSKLIFCSAFIFVGIHSFIAHKEFRFIFASLPLFAVCVSLGLESLPFQIKRVSCLLVIFLQFFSILEFQHLTFEKLGLDEKSARSAFDKSGPLNRLLLTAHQKEDLCGLLVERKHLAWTGGYSYLHKPVPLYSTRFKYPSKESFYNYIITNREPRETEIQAASDQDYNLLKVAPACQQDPDYDWKIPP